MPDPRLETWTPERIETLRLHVEAGRSFVDIAARMGLSKNSCLSKAQRMGFKPAEGAPQTIFQQHARSPLGPQRTLFDRMAELHARMDAVLAATLGRGRLPNVRSPR